MAISSEVIICTTILLTCLFLKLPVFLALLSASVAYFIMVDGVSSLIIAQRAVSGMESIPLLAVPFFICAGVLMNKTGVTRRIMDFCTVLSGRMHGGLAQVNVLLSLVMGGLSGSAIADAAMSSKMIVPEMERKGYSKAFSTVLTAVSASITPLIPPGIGMIIYGSIAGVSIGRLFMGGLGTGLLLAAGCMVLVHILAKKRGYLRLRENRITSKEFFTALKPTLFPLCLPVVIIGGIRFGVFTPTEAGSIAVVYALILGLIYREMSFKDLIDSIKETVLGVANIMLIMGTASAFAWILSREQVPQQLAALMLYYIDSRYVFLIIVNIFLLIIGMFIEGNALLIVLVPLLHPIAIAFGIDEVHFAMLFIFNLSIGTITPPLGILMFTACGITGCKSKDFYRESVPFLVMLLICLLLLTFIPGISLFFANLLF